MGGFIVKEVVFLADNGKVFAIGNYPHSPKLTSDSGVSGDMIIRAIIAVGAAEVVNIDIDPSVVMASKDYVTKELIKVDDAVKGRVKAVEDAVDVLPVSYLVTAPVLSGLIEQSIGNTLSLSVLGGVSAWNKSDLNAGIELYQWKTPEGPRNGISIDWPIANDDALVGTSLLFEVRARDALGHYSLDSHINRHTWQ